MNSYESSNSLIRPQSRAKGFILIAGVRVLALCLTMLIYSLLTIELITDNQGLGASTILLLGYLYAEARNLWARESSLFWINPVVLASIITFVMAFGVTNLLYFFPEDVLTLLRLEPNATPWMNQIMLLVILGAISMWVGYSSTMGLNMGMMLQRSRVLRKWISPSLRINKPVLYACLSISIGAKLWAIKLGVYGYSSSYDLMIEAASYTQYFAVADSLGKLALVVVAMQCFSSPSSALVDRQLLWLLLGYEVAFGFLSGMKSAVVIPFVIVGIVYYSQRNRFPRWFIPAVVFGLMAAYAVITPFRAARNQDAGFDGKSLGSIVSTISSSSNPNEMDDGDSASTTLSILTRINQTYIASLGVEYAANHEELPVGSPEFLNNIILAPAHALIPRFLWDSKPLETNGLWYTNEVLGLDFVSSTAMSPFTYLNFAGGPFAIILGFLAVGILQRGLFDGLQHFGAGGLIVFLGLLGGLVGIDNSFNNFFISLIRYIPMLVVAQYLLLLRLCR